MKCARQIVTGLIAASIVLAGCAQSNSANDPAALKAQVAPLMAAAGTSLIASADKINAMVPPNVADGPEMARGVPKALRAAGEALKNDVGKLASVSDADAPKVMSEILRNLPKSPEAMKAFDKAVSSESSIAEMMQIPACAKLLEAAG